MSFRNLLIHDVTVLTRRPSGPADNYGNPTWVTTATTVYLRGGRLEQIDGVEIIVGRDTIIANWELIVGPEVAIGALDQVQVAGFNQVNGSPITFEVVGDPKIGQTPRGAHHVTVRLRSVEG